MVGVSSAPARTFIDQARGGGNPGSQGCVVVSLRAFETFMSLPHFSCRLWFVSASWKRPLTTLTHTPCHADAQRSRVCSSGLGLGVSPTVLSVLQQRGADDMLARRGVAIGLAGASVAGAASGLPPRPAAGIPFAKVQLGAAPLTVGPAPPGPVVGGLSAALRGGAGGAHSGVAAGGLNATAAGAVAGPGALPGAAGAAAAAHGHGHPFVAGSLREAHMRTAGTALAQPIAEENSSDEEEAGEEKVGVGGRTGRVAAGRRRDSDDADSSDEEGVALGASGIRRGAGAAGTAGGSRANRLPSDSRDDGGIFDSDI